MATQVQSPLMDDDRLLPSATRNFADMIMVGNLVDHAIKNEKIDVGESNSKSKGKGNFTRKKEGEAQALF